MKIDSKTSVLGLFGNPSRHSLSPLIQNYFLKSYLINSVYLAFEPEPDNLSQAFDGAKNLGFIGLNITMPFKEKVCGLVDSIEGSASIINSINTIRLFYGKDLSQDFKPSTCRSVGYSTDGDGIIKSLEDTGFSWEGKKCLVIGAGGAAKSAVFSIYQKPVDRIYIYDIEYDRSVGLLNTMAANIMRSFDIKLHNEKNNDEKNSNNNKRQEKLKKVKKIYTDKAEEILDDIDKKITILSYIDEIEKNFDSIDLVINCTPVGMDIGNNKKDIIRYLPIPETWDLKDKFILDMVYKPLSTSFIKKAERDDAKKIITGIDMLINQAAYSFQLWFGILPGKDLIDEIKCIIKEAPVL